MKQLAIAIYLAWRDWKFEALLSLCAVLALASMLGPLLVLQGLKNGVISGMTERLLKDPATLIISPKSDAGRFDREFINKIANLPGAAYAVGRTRETAADLTLRNSEAGLASPLALEPATPGEPILKRYQVNCPVDGSIPEIVLSATAAKALNAETGAELTASLARRSTAGKLESFPIRLKVSGVLPIAAGDRRLAFAPLSLLEDIENYRDNIEVPSRGFSGAPKTGERQYASFRLYAQDLNQVEKLAAHFEELQIEVMTRARDIAAMRSLGDAINQIILIISLAVGIGFAAFMLSSSEGAIRRKKRMLGMLRLIGFGKISLIFYPAIHSMLTAISGFCLSLLIYFGVAETIGRVFANRGGLSCQLSIAEAFLALAAVALISLISSIRAAWQAACLEPSLVIREV